MKRHSGEIKPLKQDTIPKHFIFFDTETYQIKITDDKMKLPFRLGVMIYIKLNNKLEIMQRTVIHFKSLDTFYETVLQIAKKKQKLVIMAHNIGFDIRVTNLPAFFHSKGIKTEVPIINERIFIWRIRHNKINIEFLDTANLGVLSVKQLGMAIGHDKGSVQFDDTDDDTLAKYCEKDVEIIEKFTLNYLRFIHTNKLGKFAPTLASQSFIAWRKRFLTTAPIVHSEETVLQLERQAYHGGRVECFRLGDLPDDNYYYVDINSMYPYIMLSSEVPIRYMSYQENIPVSWLSRRLRDYYIIAYVTIDTGRNVYPLMVNNRLCFPVGIFDTCLHHAELAEAYQHGEIKKIHKIATYEKANIFKSYVEFFYTERLKAKANGDKNWQYIAKLFLNSLYGKFGQSGFNREYLGAYKNESVWRISGKDIDSGEYQQEICWYGEIYAENRGGESYYSCPSIAGAITTNARLLLYKYMVLSGIENVFYCDTDSLIINHKGYENLSEYIDQTKLGYLKLEKRSRIVTIHGNKDYEFGFIKKVKGVSSNAIELTKDKWSYWEFPSFISWMNDELQGTITLHERSKIRRGNYDKGVNISGIVHPYIIGADYLQKPISEDYPME